MQPTEIKQLTITIINFGILIALPFWVIWHIKYLRKLMHMSYDWWMQVLIVMCYITAICAEIPALWARWMAYYDMHLSLPDSMYIITTWDRWNHLLFYVLFMFLTWSITYKRVPRIVKETFS